MEIGNMLRVKSWVMSGLISAWVLSAAADARVGIIDLRKVFDDYYKTKAADSTLKDRANELDKERKAMLDEYQKTTQEYRKALDEANDQALSADEREKRKKAAEGRLLDVKARQQTLEDFEKTARTSLEEQQRSYREKILGEIRAVLNAKAKVAGYTLVVDSAAETVNRTPVVLFTSGENDLTAAVLSELNAAAPPPTTAAKPNDK
jgi:outer membrane protein